MSLFIGFSFVGGGSLNSNGKGAEGITADERKKWDVLFVHILLDFCHFFPRFVLLVECSLIQDNL